MHERLRGYEWPGNVRELRRVVRAAIALEDEERLLADPLTLGSTTSIPSFAELATMPFKQAHAVFERYYLTLLMRECDGNLSLAERRSKITRKSIRERMGRHGLRL